MRTGAPSCYGRPVRRRIAFGELVDRHGNELYGLAYFLTGQASDAEDVVQETFLGAYEGLGRFESRSSIRTWLRRILVKQAARHQRSKRVRKAVKPMDLSAASKVLLGGAIMDTAVSKRNSDGCVGSAADVES